MDVLVFVCFCFITQSLVLIDASSALAASELQFTVFVVIPTHTIDESGSWPPWWWNWWPAAAAGVVLAIDAFRFALRVNRIVLDIDAFRLTLRANAMPVF